MDEQAFSYLLFSLNHPTICLPSCPTMPDHVPPPAIIRQRFNSDLIPVALSDKRNAKFIAKVMKSFPHAVEIEKTAGAAPNPLYASRDEIYEALEEPYVERIAHSSSFPVTSLSDHPNSPLSSPPPSPPSLSLSLYLRVRAHACVCACV